jgi:integrase
VSFRVIQKPNGRFEVDVRGRLPNGKNYRKRLTPTVTSAKAARAFGEAHWSAVLRGEADTSQRMPTLADFYRDEFKPVHFKTGGRNGDPLKPSQVESYESHWRSHLQDRFGSWRLDDITEHEIKKFAAELQAETRRGRQRSQKTIANIVTSLMTILARARDWLKLDAPKVKISKGEQEPVEYWGFEDFARLVAAARKKSAAHLLVTLLGGQAGLRAGEILALRWEHIDFARRVIDVQFARWRHTVGKPKSNKGRYLPIADDLLAALKEHAKDAGRVVQAPRVKHATIETLRGMMGAVERAAGFIDEDGETKGAVHKLRHTFCAHLAMRNVSLLVIQGLAGHASYTTTLRYAHLAPSTLHDAVKVLGSVPTVPPPPLLVAPNAAQFAANGGTSENTPSRIKSGT